MDCDAIMRISKLLCLATFCAPPLAATAKPAKTAKAPAARPAAKPARAKPAMQPKVVTTPPRLTESGVPIRFPLDKPAYVTLVIEDATGKRVRNLIAETRLPAGNNLITWDGYDDGTRDEKGNLVRRRVAAGQYRVRGLTHSGIRLNYEFPIYSGGNPPWKSSDKSGAWMADHSSPLGAVFLPAGVSPFGGGKPQILLSALIAEAGDPLIMVDENGQRIHGEHFFGWDGGIAVMRDMGVATDQDFYAYAVMANEERVVLRALRRSGGGVEVASVPAETRMPREPAHIGVSAAVYNGLAVVSVPMDNKLVFIDTLARKVLGSSPLPSPRGVYFDARGNLFAISNNTVKRFRIANLQEPKLDAGTVLIDDNLVQAHSLTGDSAGNLYVADWGKLHQVKVFGADGTYKRVIGKPGGLQLGLYDEQRMHSPQGLTIDHKGRLWIAEADHLPKRISVWNASTGKFEMAKYGPPHYGGGGTIDPVDPTRAFYAEFGGLMEFDLDWKAGTSRVKAISSRQSLQGFANLPGENWWPERAVHANGRTYLVGNYQGGLRGNTNSAVFLLDEKTHIARPVAYVGSDRWWDTVAKDPAMKELMPGKKNEHFLTWSDLNNDGSPQPNEIKYRVFSEKVIYPAWNNANGNNEVEHGEVKVMPDGKEGGIYGFRDFYPQPDLSMVGRWGIRVPAPSFRADGVPIYDLEKATFLINPRNVLPGLEDGELLMPSPDGTLLTGTVGYKNDEIAWSYPARWDYNDVSQGPGDMNYATRALGPVMKAPAGEAGYFTAWNGEKGNIFLLTTDGLFIQQLGGDMRTHPLLRLPQAKRGMSVDGLSFEDEHFHPTMTRTDKGDVFLVAGKEHSSIFRVTGWDSVKRREFARLNLVQSTLAALPETKTSAARRQGRQRLKVAMHGAPLTVDGGLNEWQSADWATISPSISGAVAFSDDTLYAAWKTSDEKLLSNSGATTNNLFKGGGALDLMIGTNRDADLNRSEPVAGDLRLLITRVKSQPRATLYRAVVPGTPDAKKVLFESPVGKVLFDEVRDVTAQVKLAQQGGNYEISVPLQLLGMKPEQESTILGDIGVLRGDGSQTIQRLYWNNLNTAIVSDIPSEARLQPVNWGQWKIVANTQINDGSLALRPQDARLVGEGIRLKKIGDGEDAEYSIGFWDNRSASLRWQIEVTQAGKYHVDLTYGNGGVANEFIFSAGEQKLGGKTANTGGWETWKTVRLGELTLPQGLSTFELSPTPQLVGGLMDFKLLRLVPVQ